MFVDDFGSEVGFGSCFCEVGLDFGYEVCGLFGHVCLPGIREALPCWASAWVVLLGIRVSTFGKRGHVVDVMLATAGIPQ